MTTNTNTELTQPPKASSSISTQTSTGYTAGYEQHPPMKMNFSTREGLVLQAFIREQATSSAYKRELKWIQSNH